MGNRIVCTPKHTGPIKRSGLGSPGGRLSAGSSSARFDPNPASTAGFHLAVRSVASHGDHAPTLDVVQAAEQCVLLSTRRPQNVPGLHAAPHRGLRYRRVPGVHSSRRVISARVLDQGRLTVRWPNSHIFGDKPSESVMMPLRHPGETVTVRRTRMGLRLVLHHAVRARPLSDSTRAANACCSTATAQ